MYQSIIRDPGGNGLIRIQPDVCDNTPRLSTGVFWLSLREPLRSLLSTVRFRAPMAPADTKSSQALIPSL